MALYILLALKVSLSMHRSLHSQTGIGLVNNALIKAFLMASRIIIGNRTMIPCRNYLEIHYFLDVIPTDLNLHEVKQSPSP